MGNQIKLRRDVQYDFQCPNQLPLELETGGRPISLTAGSQGLRLFVHTHNLPLNDMNLTSTRQLSGFISCHWYLWSDHPIPDPDPMTGRYRSSPDRTCRGRQAVAVDAYTSVPFPWKRICDCVGRCWRIYLCPKDLGDSHFTRPHLIIATSGIWSRYQNAPRGLGQRCSHGHETGYFELILCGGL